MKTIIVPINFSPAAINAARYAIDMALAIDATILLIHNIIMPMEVSEISVSADVVNGFQNEAKNEMEDTKMKLTLYAKDKISMSYIVTNGVLIDEIKALVEKQKPFAVIMGMHGSVSAPRWLMGSSAFDALHQLDCPTIIIPESIQYRTPKNIALACDMHDVADTVPVGTITDLTALFNSSLAVLYVGKSDERRWETLTESISLQNILAKFHPEFHFISNRNIVAAISDYVNKKEVDLLIIIPKKRNFLSSIFHKSISNNIIAHITVPVMTLHG